MNLITEQEKEKLIREIFDNFPEASHGWTLECHGWDYKNFSFDFTDTEENKEYTITLEMAKKGFDKLIPDVLHGKIHLPFGEAIFDAGSWDSECADALAQYSIFGEAIYG